MSTDARAALLVFSIGFVTALWFFNGGGQNQNVNFDLARAIVEQHSLRVDDYRDNTVDLSFAGGHYYSNKPPGLSVLAAVPYSFTRLFTRNLDFSPAIRLTIDQYIATGFVCGVSLGLIGVLLYLIGIEGMIPRPWAALVATATVIATPLLPYATMLFAHVPNALTLLGSIWFATRTRVRPVASGLCAGFAASLNYVAAPAALVPLYFLMRREGWKPALTFILSAAPLALLLMAYHWYAFGSPFTTAISSTNIEFIDPDATMGVLDPPTFSVVWGLLGSPYRGLFYCAPFLLFAVAGLWKRRSEPLSRAAALLSIAFVVFFASFNGWHGGYTYGPRYLLPVVPLLATGLLAFHPKTILRTAIAILAIWSFGLNLIATAVDPQVPEVIENPLFDYLVPTYFAGQPPRIADAPWLHDFFTGSVGINRLTVSERQIFRKYPPGSPETEWASFNLGEPLGGTGSRASILPLLLLQIILGGVLARLIRQDFQTESASQQTIA